MTRTGISFESPVRVLMVVLPVTSLLFGMNIPTHPFNTQECSNFTAARKRRGGNQVTGSGRLHLQPG